MVQMVIMWEPSIMIDLFIVHPTVLESVLPSRLTTEPDPEGLTGQRQLFGATNQIFQIEVTGWILEKPYILENFLVFIFRNLSNYLGTHHGFLLIVDFRAGITRPVFISCLK